MKRRLLVFEQRMMGDAIMSLPFIRAAHERYEVFVACAPGGRPVFERVLSEDHLLEWCPPWLAEQGKYAPSRWWQSGLREFANRCRATTPDVAVSVWPDARTHLLMGWSGAKERVGYPMVAANYYANQLGWRKRQLLIGPLMSLLGSVCLLRPLLTRKLIREDYMQHHVENWRQLAGALELNWNTTTPWLPVPEISLPGEPDSFIARARAAGRQLWLVHPGARTANRRWPLERFQAVIQETMLPGNAAVILVKPPEMELGRDIDPRVLIAKPESLGELMRLTHLVDHVLCNDTGVAHVAAALGRRTVSVFTANLPQWFAPHGSNDLALDHQACPHRPCLDRCVMPSFVCRDAVPAEQVSVLVRQLLARDRPSPTGKSG